MPIFSLSWLSQIHQQCTNRQVWSDDHKKNTHGKAIKLIHFVRGIHEVCTNVLVRIFVTSFENKLDILHNQIFIAVGSQVHCNVSQNLGKPTHWTDKGGYYHAQNENRRSAYTHKASYKEWACRSRAKGNWLETSGQDWPQVRSISQHILGNDERVWIHLGWSSRLHKLRKTPHWNSIR